MSNLKSFTPYPMQGYWGKQLGFAIVLFSAVLFCLFTFTNLSIIETGSKIDHAIASLWLMCFGYFSMMMSKEKVEDERVQKIRAKSMQIFISVLLAPMVSIGFAGSIIRDFQTNVTSLTLLILSFLIYSIYFNYSIKYDPEWNYSDGSGVDNFRIMSKKKFSILIVLATILPILIILWSK